MRFGFHYTLLALLYPTLLMACPSAYGLYDLNCDGKITIATFGDSITRGVGDSTGLGYPGRLSILLPGVEILNFGVPGEKTNIGKQRATSVFGGAQNFDYTIVLEGVNDYFQETRSSQETKENLLQIIRSSRNSTAVSLLSKLTNVKRDFQRPWVESVNARLSGLTQVDFFKLGTSIISGDLLHPDGAGYQRMAQEAYNSLLNQSFALYQADPERFRDSDNDGIWDYGEQIYKTNPFLVDSDFDGVSDNLELFVYSSNPLQIDTDGDGFSDFHEIVVLKTDPTSRRPGAPAITSFEYSKPLELR